MLQSFLLVGFGGMTGAMLRYACYLACARFSTTALATIFVNILGSFLIGLIIGLHETKFPLTEAWKLLACVGVLGGFTTFSAFSLDMLYFLREGRVALAALYAGVMLMLGLLAVYFGFRSAALF